MAHWLTCFVLLGEVGDKLQKLIGCLEVLLPKTETRAIPMVSPRHSPIFMDYPSVEHDFSPVPPLRFDEEPEMEEHGADVLSTPHRTPSAPSA